ncbi:uncharacterized protein LOC100368019 [Saccoglossus kowalevskii]|uniref:FK506-binding protein 5-like n=1 Tax=Saccoglossus kowalevskii TaxID=10224 RepID=A0ABM0M0I1_SACKO|nr:PREDICTED: FK506-binding protein 5-like [Saccoglossus kowalevskii]
MSKVTSRTVVVGSSSTDAGIVAGDEDFTSAFLKNFKFKGSVRIYSFQGDENVDDQPKYRTFSPDEIFIPTTEQKEETVTEVNNQAKNDDQKLQIKKESRFKKKKEIEVDKSKAKEREKEEKSKEKAKRAKLKAEEKNKKREEKKSTQAATSAVIVKKDTKEETQIKENDTVLVNGTQVGLEVRNNEVNITVLGADVDVTLATVTDDKEKNVREEKLENKEIENRHGDEKDIDTSVALPVVTERAKHVEEEEIKKEVQKEVEQRKYTPHNEVKAKEVIIIEKDPVKMENVTNILQIKEGNAVNREKKVVPMPEPEVEIQEEKDGEIDMVAKANLKEEVFVKDDIDITVKIPEVIIEVKENKNDNITSVSKSENVNVTKDVEKVIVVPEIENREVSIENKVVVTESGVSKVTEIEEKSVIVPPTISEEAANKPDVVPEVIIPCPIKHEMEKIELPAEEKPRHIEVQVQINNTGEERRHGGNMYVKKKEMATKQQKNLHSNKETMEVITVVDSSETNGHAKPPVNHQQSQRPHTKSGQHDVRPQQSGVVLTEQMVRQMQQQRVADGSVSSRASSAVAVPRSMIRGRTWSAASVASTQQVLQNVAANGSANGSPVGAKKSKHMGKAELIFEFGRKGTRLGRLRRPHGISVSSASDIVICDAGNHRVQIFGWDCKYKAKWSPDGLGRRLFSRDRFDPGDVAVTPDNKHFIVSDFTTEKLYKVTMGGKLVKEFGESGLKGPWGVAINSKGIIYVSYCMSNCLALYDENGKCIGRIGRHGTGPSEFRYPCYIAINQRDAVVVAEYHGRRVQVLNPEGKFLFQIGSTQHFREISGVAVDSYNNVFVADYKCNRVVMYGNDGVHKMCIGDEEDRIERPEGVSISPEGYIVVSDSGNNNIKIFRYWDVRHLLD